MYTMTGERTAAHTAAIDVCAVIALHKAGGLADCDDYHAWLMQFIAPYGGRTALAARATLFEIGAASENYFLVVSGELLALRSARPDRPPTVRHLKPGDFFAFECGGRHEADCYASVDSVVLPMDRAWLLHMAQHSRSLANVLQAMHANDLAFVDQSILSDTRCDRAGSAAQACALVMRWTDAIERLSALASSPRLTALPLRGHD